jgi:HSP20 family molecular chaperone IbpA
MNKKIKNTKNFELKLQILPLPSQNKKVFLLKIVYNKSNIFMAKIKQKINITDAEASNIRREWDTERQRQYYSVADVMGILTDSIDTRNYWKALKNRLKTNHNQLVMDCNQVKMRASDGKLYLTDVADADTIIKIIQCISPYNVTPFKAWFEHVDVQSTINTDISLTQNNPDVIYSGTSNDYTETEEDELSTTLTPAIDMRENRKEIVVQIMLPGVHPDKIIITTNMNTLTIRGTRVPLNEVEVSNFLHKELQYGQFARIIELPSLVDVDQITATEKVGLITISLPKIDQEKNRFIKIKSL